MTNYTDPDETVEYERTYTWWIIRRAVAWASKQVPETDLPPIYGPSQVCDIHPYEQNSNFKIKGTAEENASLASLNLYYKFSDNNESFTDDWILYEKDTDISDGWSWDFNAPNGAGYYQFCSIREVEYQGVIEIEKYPPGPDAIAKVD